MKNNIFTNLWVVYKDTLPETTLKRVPRIEKSIQEFEDMGYDISTMNRAEAKKFGKLLSKDLSYSTAVAYCSILNKFLALCEDKTNTQYERIYSDMIPIRCDLYLTEDEFLNDVYSWAKELTDEVSKERNLTAEETTHVAEHYYSAICLLTLAWYGLTYAEMSHIKFIDIDENDYTISIRRNDKPVIIWLSDKAFKAVDQYRKLTSITNYYKNPVVFNLPNSGYLFRLARNKKNEKELYEPISIITLAATRFKFCRGSNIKKQIELSGAFSTIEDRITTPANLCGRVRRYIGDNPISNNTIQNSWIIYLDELAKAEQKGKDA